MGLTGALIYIQLCTNFFLLRGKLTPVNFPQPVPRGVIHEITRVAATEVTAQALHARGVANKDILMARSDYFQMMFSNNMFIEGETSSVDMSHSSKAIMEKIINYLICGQIRFTDISFTQVMELLDMSRMMLLNEFGSEVEKMYLF